MKAFYLEVTPSVNLVFLECLIPVGPRVPPTAALEASAVKDVYGPKEVTPSRMLHSSASQEVLNRMICLCSLSGIGTECPLFTLRSCDA